MPVIAAGQEPDTRDRILGLFPDGFRTVEGIAVGVAGSPGKFYLLEKELSVSKDEQQYRAYLKDTAPQLRIMGLLCLARCGFDFPVMEGDSERILAQPFGCMPEQMTIEAFSKRLKNDHDFKNMPSSEQAFSL